MDIISYALSKKYTDKKITEQKLKVATVEKELNNFKGVISQVNVNQEATQKASGYGIISLPKNAANGQINDIRIEGNTYTNLLGEDGDFSKGVGSWYSARSTISVENNQLKIVAAGSVNWGACRYTTNIIAQEGKTYFIRLKVKVTNSLSSAIRIQVTDESFVGGIVKEIKSPVENHVYDVYVKGTTTANLTGNLCLNIVHFYPDANTAKDKVMYIQDIMLVDLDQTGDADKTEEELVEKYPFINGTKSTVSAIRARSVGKNILGGEKFAQSVIKTVDSSTNAYKTTVDNRNVLALVGSGEVRLKTVFDKFKENTQYTVQVYAKKKEELNGGYLMFEYTDGTGQGIYPISTSWEKIVVTSDAGKTIRDLRTTYSNREKTNYYDIDTFQIEEGDTATEYEPYKESVAYITAKDEEGNIIELNSLPNGVQDKIYSKDEKWYLEKNTGEIVFNGTENWRLSSIDENTIRFSCITSLANIVKSKGWVTNYFIYDSNYDLDKELISAFDTTNNHIIIRIDKSKLQSQDVTGFKQWLSENPTQLIYQLESPITLPVQVSGNLITYPSGTIYIEPVVADAGIYGANGIGVLHQELPIDSLDKLSKIDFETGLETELDTSQAVISEDGTYFTHPELVEGDIVFFEYYYPSDMTTQGETEVEYYDSRYVIKDSVTGKFYKWKIAVANGTPTIELEEV